MEEGRQNKILKNGPDVDTGENDRGSQPFWDQEQGHEMRTSIEGNEELNEDNENNLKENWEQFTTHRDQIKEEDIQQIEFDNERNKEPDSGNGRQIEDEVGVNELSASADNEQELNDEDQELYRRYQNLYRKYQKQYQEFQEEYGETEDQQEENGDMIDHGEYDEEQYRQYFEQIRYGAEQYNHTGEESGEEVEEGHYDDEKYRENIQMGAIIQDALKTEDDSLENTTETPRKRNKQEDTAEYGQEGNLAEADENEYSDGETSLMITENGVTSVTSDGNIRVKIQPTDKEYETALLMGGEIMFDDVQIDEDDESENEEKKEKDEKQESELPSKPVVFDTEINIEEIDKAILESLEKYSGGKVKDATEKETDLDVKSSKSKNKDTITTVQLEEKGMLVGLTNLKALSFNAQNREILDSFRNKNYQSPAGPRKPKAPKRFACDVCGTAFAKKNNLQKHQKTHLDEKPFACETCDARFTTKSNMQAHMRLHTGEKPYKCEICDAAFSQRGNLTKHLSIHTGEKPYKCYFCEAAFSDRGTMKTHIMLHTGERPYKCDQCKAEFTVESKLIKHQRMHTGERPYKCDICNAAFIHKTSLNKHMKRQIHNGDTPFKCQYCDLELTSQVRLTNHLRTHTEEKPFKCDSCHAEFSMKCSLAVHQRIHTGEKPFKCELCDATFSQRGSLTVHQRIHTGEKPFQCKVCGASFFQKGSLCVHMRLHTNVNDENATDKVFSAYLADSKPAEPGTEIGAGPGTGSEQDSLVPKKKKRAPRKKKADKVQEQKNTESSKEYGNNDEGEVKRGEVSGVVDLEETKTKKKRKYTKKSSKDKKLGDVLDKGIADTNSGEKNEPYPNVFTYTKSIKHILGNQPINMKLEPSVSPAMLRGMVQDAEKKRKEQEKKETEAAKKKEKKKLEEATIPELPECENQIKEKIRTKIEKDRISVCESQAEQESTPKDYSKNQVMEKVEKQENTVSERAQISHFDHNENQRNDQVKNQSIHPEEFHVNNHFENPYSDTRKHSISNFDKPQNLVTSKKIDIPMSDKNTEETSNKRKYDTVENHDLSSHENGLRSLQGNVLNYSNKKFKLEDNMASPFPSVNVQQGGDNVKSKSIENVGHTVHSYHGKMPGFESSIDPRFPMVNNFGYQITPKQEPIPNSSKGIENHDYWRQYGGMGSMSRYDTKTSQGYLPSENPAMYSQQNWGFYPTQNMRFDTSTVQRFHPAFNFGLGAAGNWGIYPSNFPGFHTGAGQQSRSSEGQQYHTSEQQRFQGTENELMGTATHNWNFYAGKTPMYDTNHGQKCDGNTKQNYSSGDAIAKPTDCTTTFKT